MNPSTLHFDRLSGFFKFALFAGAAVVCLYGGHDMITPDPEPYRQIILPGGLELPAPAPRQVPAAPLKALVLFIGACLSIFYAAKYGWQMFISEVAVGIDHNRIHFHSSIAGAPDSLLLSDINVVLFDRADKIPQTDNWQWLTGSSAARMGSRARHALYIEYRSGERLQLTDNDFNGGASQLERFADYLEKMRVGKARFSGP